MRGQVVVRTIALATVLLAASCSSSEGSSAPNTEASNGAGSVQSTPGPRGGGNTAAQGGNGNAAGPSVAPLPSGLETTAAPGDASGPGGGPGKDKGPPKPPPAQIPPEADVVAVRAAVSPLCVERGGRLTLEVETEPKSAIGWQAVYSDGLGGGEPPFGGGYGGNDKGFASKQGAYSATWVVAPNAPVGRSRVDVVSGYRGEFGYDGPRFAVADDDGNCPESWIRGEE